LHHSLPPACLGIPDQHRTIEMMLRGIREDGWAAK